MVPYNIRLDTLVHCRQCFDFAKNRVTKRNPYSIIYAFQDFTLDVWNCSHLVCGYHVEEGRSVHDNFMRYHSVMKQQLLVKQGCFIIFDGALVHAGTPFGRGEGRCYRMHFYLTPNDVYASDETYKSCTFCDNCEKCQALVNHHVQYQLLWGE